MLNQISQLRKTPLVWKQTKMKQHGEVPNPKSQISTAKMRCRGRPAFLDLLVGICLEIGIWCLGFFLCLAAPLLTSRTSAAEADLPPRTLPTGPALCPPIPWVQTDLRI